MNKNQPKVSVFIPTYYHEKYISQAIDSVLSQKTSFKVEIFITDDASQDRTPEIIKKYAEKYDNISYYINKTNIGLSNNILLGMKSCIGEYIIGLSGDDYWIDNNKLQTQVDFLDSHSEYIAVCTRLELRADNNKEPLRVVPDIKICNAKFTKEMFLKGINTPLNGMLMRNVFLDKELKKMFEVMPQISKYIDDLTNNLFILMAGDVYVLEDATVAYRVRVNIKTDKNFNSTNKGLLLFERHIDLLNNLDAYLNHSEDLFCRYKIIVFEGLIKAIKLKQFKRFYKKYKTIPDLYRKKHLLVSCMELVLQELINRLKKTLINKKNIIMALKYVIGFCNYYRLNNNLW